MNYIIKYELEHIHRDMELEKLVENLNQHILKKYLLSSAEKQAKGDFYCSYLSNIDEPEMFNYDRNYQKMKKNPETN